MSRPLIFDSVEAMLAPAALTELLGAAVQSVERKPFSGEHLSGNALYELWIETAAGRTRLYLKEFIPTRDWVMKLTHDTVTREIALYVQGVYPQITNLMHVPLIAVARSGGAWASLMRDVSEGLLPPRQPMTPDVAQLLIKKLAALHGRFVDAPLLENPALGLASLEDYLTILTPARVRGELGTRQVHPVMMLASDGWDMFDEEAPPDMREFIRALQRDPSPLMAVLNRLPCVLTHGDYKLGNLGVIKKQGSAAIPIVLDWQDATNGRPFLDMGYFLALNARQMPFSKETAIEQYGAALEKFGIAADAQVREAALFAGGPLRLLWLMVLGTRSENADMRERSRADLEWWYALMRRVAKLF